MFPLECILLTLPHVFLLCIICSTLCFSYVSNTALTHLRIGRIMNHKERHGNGITSKATVSDTLHDSLVLKGSKGCDEFFKHV